MKSWVLNGWASSPHAWDLCASLKGARIFSYVEQLDGIPEREIKNVDSLLLVGWSMGGSSALRIALKYPEKVKGLVLIAATPRMLEDKESGWRGMSAHRLEALRKGLEMTHGEGFFGIPEGKPNPYMMDTNENLSRGLKYLAETDIRAELLAFSGLKDIPVAIFQSERDGIVRATNAEFLKSVFSQAKVTIVPGTEHALSIVIPELIDEFCKTILTG